MTLSSKNSTDELKPMKPKAVKAIPSQKLAMKRTFPRDVNKEDLMRSVMLSRKKTKIKLVG